MIYVATNRGVNFSAISCDLTWTYSVQGRRTITLHTLGKMRMQPDIGCFP
jgi:hypothetical protein